MKYISLLINTFGTRLSLVNITTERTVSETEWDCPKSHQLETFPKELIMTSWLQTTDIWSSLTKAFDASPTH